MDPLPPAGAPIGDDPPFVHYPRRHLAGCPTLDPIPTPCTCAPIPKDHHGTTPPAST